LLQHFANSNDEQHPWGQKEDKQCGRQPGVLGLMLEHIFHGHFLVCLLSAFISIPLSE